MLDKIKMFQKQFERPGQAGAAGPVDPVAKPGPAAWLANLRDVRSLGLVVFAVIVLLVSWSGVGAIQSNYKLQQEMARLQQENNIQELENNNQRLRNEYYKTSQYLELAARQNLGLAAPGEKQLLVPKEVAMAQVQGVKVPAAPASSSDAPDKQKQPFYQRNINAWLDFFLHRGGTEGEV